MIDAASRPRSWSFPLFSVLLLYEDQYRDDITDYVTLTFNFNCLVLIFSAPTYQKFQPPHDFKFPSRQFGSRKRSCQRSWFDTWDWLHYRSADDKLFCDLCITAERRGEVYVVGFVRQIINIIFSTLLY